MSTAVRVLTTLLAALPATPGIAANCTVFDKLDTVMDNGPAPSRATCVTYLTAAATTGTSCHWTFAFRDADALAFADDLTQELQSCRPGEQLGADQIVNHPDSYDLREWQTPSGTYAISVKDKGALNRTLVFLRFEPD